MQYYAIHKEGESDNKQAYIYALVFDSKNSCFLIIEINELFTVLQPVYN